MIAARVQTKQSKAPSRSARSAPSTRARTGDTPSPVPTPEAAAEPERLVDVAADEKEVDGLIREWKAGARDMTPLELRPIPDSASKGVRATYRFFAIVGGLRVDVDAYDDVLFAQDWAAGWITALGRPITGMQVGRCLKRLRAWGVLEKTGERKIPGRPKPAFLYRPCAVAVDRNTEVAGQRSHEPSAESVDHALMARAEGAVADRPLAAVRHGAGDGGGLHNGDHGIDSGATAG